MAQEECIFCRIIAGKAEAYKVHEGERSIAILDINPLAQGHCLVLPKRHVPFWHDLSEEELADLFKTAKAVAGKIMKAYQPDFVGIHARGRRVNHTHIFLVPAYKDGPLDRFFYALEGFQVAPPVLAALREKETMKETCESLKKA